MVLVRVLKPVVPAPLRRQLRHVQSLRWLPYNSWGDTVWAAQRFRTAHGRWPSRSSWLFNDVLFRVRVTELNLPERVRISDKELVKQFVAERIGDRHNVPTLAILRSPSEVKDFDFPDQCVIKPTHMSQEAIFRTKGEAVEWGQITEWFNHNFYYESREANYKPLNPKVIVEPYVFGRLYPETSDDFRISCVNGEPRMIRVVTGRYTDPRCSTYDVRWRRIPFTVSYPAGPDIARPANLDEMLAAAAELSQGFSWLRVDMYSDGTNVAVGELTNCSNGAIEPTIAEESASRLLWPERW